MGVGQIIAVIKSNQQAVQGFPVNRFYTKAESDNKFALKGSSGSQTPWLQDEDADGYKLYDLGEIDFRGIGELKGYYMAFGTTTFSGAGLNDLIFTGLYSGTGSPTYRFTVTYLNAQTVFVDDTTGFLAGNGVTGTFGTTGIVASVVDGTTLIIANGTDDWNNEPAITDDVTFANTNTEGAGLISDIGDFTDGTTTLHFQPIINGTAIQGINHAAIASQGHTVTNYWQFTIIPTVADGLKLDFQNSLFSLGDHEQKTLGNEFLTDYFSGEIRHQMRDKNDIWFTMGGDGNTHRPTFKGLGGLGSTGRYAALDDDGQILNVPSPLAINANIGGGNQNGFYLYDNFSGQLKEGSSGSGGIQQDGNNVVIYGDAYIVKDRSGNLFYDFDMITGSHVIRQGDLSGVLSNMKMFMDLDSGNVDFFNVQNFTISAGANFTLQDNSGNPAILGSLISGAIAFQLGDLLGTGNTTYLSVVDSTATMKFAANARFYAGGSNAANIYLDCNTTAGTYDFGASNYGNSTYIHINDTQKNIALNGGLIVSTQYVTPTTGSSVTILDNTTVLTINPAGAILALTIVFPTAYDGRVVEFNTTQTITALTLSGGTFVGGLTTLGIAGFAQYIYSSGDSKWHRQG